MKALFQNAKKWAIANPKSFYKYAMGILIITFVINMTFSVLSYNKNKDNKNYIIPMLYQQTDQVIKKQEEKEKKIELINEELKGFKVKRDNGILSSADSLRIEFLYEQYKTLTNGKEN
ncbi:MAG: hypothetical protein Q3983_07625 [Capnocytophaga sp.]|nr:hypothetical protein [Capnocytophaga sp.]